ncbi:MAG: hypothetical protein RR144_03070, partial [Clostridia bacterium]
IVLEHQIDTKLYDRQTIANKDNNFKNTLINPQSDLANDLQKDPYIFNLPLLKKKYIETELENALVERIKDVLLELYYVKAKINLKLNIHLKILINQ